MMMPVLAVLLLVAVAFALVWLNAQTKPTNGDKIADYADPQKAVVIIDLQEDYTGTGTKPPFPYKKAAQTIQTLNRVAQVATQRGLFVIYVRHEYRGLSGWIFSKIFSNGTALPGTPGAALDRRLSVGPQPVFTKTTADAFSCPAFAAFLVEHRINALYLAGLDAEYCVYATAQGAVNRGYKVSVISDGLLLQAENHEERLMQKFVRSGVRLVPADELCDRNHVT